MAVKNQNLKIEDKDTTGIVKWKCPSNLAIVKYWGKYAIQYPRNPSLSLTLDKAYTITQMDYRYKETGGISLDFLFEGEKKSSFARRIHRYLEKILEYFPFIEDLHLDISSENSFPHSSGIASSASAMGALALCLCSVEKEIFGTLNSEHEFLNKASYIARLGSGSASRSVYPYGAIWGSHKYIKNSSQDFAIPFGDEMHPIFQSFHDDILIVSGKEKSVSSSAGHSLMDNNPFASARYDQARERMVELVACMRAGDVDDFGQIAEDEAMTLHALMMCSHPSYMLIEPGSIAIMKKIRAFRKDTHVPVFFSLDAGPNIHLLYPDNEKVKVKDFIESELKEHCQKIIHDQVGKGPQQL